jgi:hypothetical protein
MGGERLAPLEGRAIGAVGATTSAATTSAATTSAATTSAVTTSAAGAILARDRLLPLSAPLAGLFPEGGLRRGSTVVIGRGASPGMTSLALTLLSGPCASGSWCAVVGAPDIGLVAAGQLGSDLERLALVPSPGPRWATVTAALLEGFDVVLLQGAGQVGHSDARKLEARARERGSVLAVMGDRWPGSAAVRLDIVGGRWCGLEDGSGHLWGREVEVVASGRGAASRPQRARIWFGQPEFQPVAKLELAKLELAKLELAKLELAGHDPVEAATAVDIAG